MSHTFRQVDRGTLYLLPPSLNDWLPEGHLARFVVEMVEQLALTSIKAAYAGRGSKAHHPEMLLALLVYGYATGVFSSRKLERATYDSVAVRYLAANHHPDHDTIATFRKHFLAELKLLFVQIRALYDLLEREVIPEFYTREESGIPAAWVKRIRENMAQLTPRFSTNRTVREYTEQRYLPAAVAYRTRAAEKGAIGGQVLKWRHALEQQSAALRYGHVKGETRGERFRSVSMTSTPRLCLRPAHQRTCSARVILHCAGDSTGRRTNPVATMIHSRGLSLQTAISHWPLFRETIDKGVN